MLTMLTSPMVTCTTVYGIAQTSQCVSECRCFSNMEAGAIYNAFVHNLKEQCLNEISGKENEQCLLPLTWLQFSLPFCM